MFAAALSAFAPTAHAAAVLNGNFTATSGTFGTVGGGLNTVGDYTAGGNLTNWTISDVSGSTGLAVLYLSGNQGSTTSNGVGVSNTSRFGAFSVYDPGNISGTTPTGGAIPNTSPGGGNFITADGAVGFQVAIYQTITSLTVGQNYAVSFYYAAGQQSGFTGSTTEGWQVSLTSSAQLTQATANGTTIQDTPAQSGGSLAQGAFQAWALDTMTFTATSTSEVLTFLSMGTPSGQPPVNFLSDVVLTATPEPGSVGLFGIGIASLAGLIRLRRRKQ